MDPRAMDDVDPPQSRSGPPGLLTIPAEIMLEISDSLTVADLLRLGRTCKKLLPTCLSIAYNMVGEMPQESIDQSLSHAMLISSAKLLLKIREAVMRKGRKFSLDHGISSEEGEPMLMTAVASREYELAEVLLRHGAEVDFKHNGKTPLEKALAIAEERNGHVCPRNMVNLLVRYYADVREPAEMLMRLDNCHVHEGSSECFVDMGTMILRQIAEFEEQEGLCERLVAWMNRIVRLYPSPTQEVPEQFDPEDWEMDEKKGNEMEGFEMGGDEDGE